MRKTTMVFSNIILILVVISVSCTAADGALSWGTFLGADWKLGEGETAETTMGAAQITIVTLFLLQPPISILTPLFAPLHPPLHYDGRRHSENMRNDIAVFIKNTQRICTKDVEKICTKGKYVTPQTTAYTNWSGTFKRHMYKHWREVPIGFGSASDECLNDEFVQYQSGVSKRLIPKCVEWMEKTKGQFDKICKREKGNDKREAFVIFSTIFATAVSGVVGYMLGIFLKERDDLFSYHNRHENKKILIFFCVAISLPLCVIMWASPKLLMVMVGAFGIGRGAQFYVQKKQDREYLAVPGSDSGLVFAAIPVQMN